MKMIRLPQIIIFLSLIVSTTFAKDVQIKWQDIDIGDQNNNVKFQYDFTGWGEYTCRFFRTEKTSTAKGLVKKV